MIRLTRLVNPTFLNPRHLIPTARSLPPPSSPPLISFPRLPRHLAFTRRRDMETENLAASITDDFVTVENPVDDDSTSSAVLGNSNYVNVEKSGDVEGEVAAGVDVREGNTGVGGGEEEIIINVDEIMRNVVVLTCENCDGDTCNVYLVGTAHVSEESCKEVQAVISYLKPEVVFLELCASRVHLLSLRDLKVPTFNEMIGMLKRKQNVFGVIYSWFLAKVADKMDVLPGSEFRVGYEEAMKCGSKVILGDRPVNITLRRTWGKMPLWHKAKLIYGLLFNAVFLPSPEELDKLLKQLDDSDMLTLVIQEMSKEFPTLMETLVNERDLYMSSALFNVASEHTSVVAVVGKGHLVGIKKYWRQPIEVDKLMEIPPRSPVVSVVKVLTTVGVAVAGVAIVSGIFFASKKQS